MTRTRLHKEHVKIAMCGAQEILVPALPNFEPSEYRSLYPQNPECLTVKILGVKETTFKKTNQGSMFQFRST